MNTSALWPQLRNGFRQIHLWLGILSGMVLFVVCLSGTIYTFGTEIQKALQPSKYQVAKSSQNQRLSVDELIQQAQDQLGDTLKVTSLKIYADQKATVELNLKKAVTKGSDREVKNGRAEKSGNGRNDDKVRGKSEDPDKVSTDSDSGKGQRIPGKKDEFGGQGSKRDRGVNYLMNPYTGQILGTTDGAAAEFFQTIFKLHRWLLLDTKLGRPIVGWATVIFIIMILSGLIIWIPNKIKAWKQGLKIKWSANWKRLNHDLHNTLGFYASILLLIMAFTGLTWSFEWYKNGFYRLLGQDPATQRSTHMHSSMPDDTFNVYKSINYDYLIQQSNEILSYKGDYRLSVPQEPDDAIRISKSKVGFFAIATADVLVFDRYSGALINAEIFAEKTFGEKIARSIKPIHTGEIFGTFSKIIYFIACLIATTLPITGTLIWINKLRRKKS
jgi:uncharacterized iron-regulated membrane protein